MDRMKRLAETIRTLTDGQFSGYIKINFSQGSIGRVEKFEELEDASIFYAGDPKDENPVGHETYI